MKKLLALDIETESITEDKEDALNPRKSRITCIGIYGEGNSKIVFRAPWDKFLSQIYYNQDYTFVGQNFKFDLKHMAHHFGEMPNWQERWEDDTRLMAFVCTEKIPQEYIDAYEERRKELNKNRKNNHREAKFHSLKTLAPYFLGVDAFWEPDESHNSDEYVLKDCEYTYKLFEFMFSKLSALGQHDFYKNKLMPWTKMILAAELEGVTLDVKQVESLQSAYCQEIKDLTATLKVAWESHYIAYKNKCIAELNTQYQDMFQAAALKTKNKSLVDLQLKYVNLFERAKKKMFDNNDCELSLDSPAQLKWLLRDRLNLDVVNLEGDESTGKEVLQRLAKEDDTVAKLLRLRKLTKLVTAFFPKYMSLKTETNKIHADYNIDGTRTGRLSSSGPNMQQHPRELKDLFIAGDKHKFVTYDVTAIEPLLMAYYSEDAALTKLIQEGKSLHSVNAIIMFGLDCEEHEVKDKYPTERQIAKTIGLACLYGAGWNQVKMAGQKEGRFFTERECKQIVYRIRDTYSGVWDFKQALDLEMEQGTVIYNFMGRPMRIDNPEDVYMKAFNTLIQGSASDLVLDIGLDIVENTNSTPVMFVHDSIVSLVNTDAADVDYEEICIRHLFKRELTNASTTFKLEVDGGISDVWE